jgi:hypothetical protein
MAPGLLLAAALSWVPLVSVLVSPQTWVNRPTEVPTHWNLNGLPDGWDPAPVSLGFCILFGVTLGIACTLVVVLNRDDLPRWKGAAGLGAVALFLGALTWLWFVMISAAADSPGTGSNGWVVAGAGFAYGLVMAVLIALPRYVTPERPPGSSAEDVDAPTS